jgi:hypothetical protein
VIEIKGEAANMDDAKLKAILLSLTKALEDVTASSAASIALLLRTSRGTLSETDVRRAIQEMTPSVKRTFDQVRKQIEELS